MKNNLITCLPNAASLIESMRSIGYSFETAIADILDNSISAQATKIDIYYRQKDGEPYIEILDNGTGMNQSELFEAMRLGSKNPVEDRKRNDLGRFGLGLKSASFSQVRNLTLISKKNDKISAYKWDLDVVAQTQNFDLNILSKDEIQKVPNIEYLLNIDHGTIVLWQKFDRLENSTSDLNDELTHLMDKSIDHLSLIFHRILHKKIQIFINNDLIEPKDPFLENHPGTQERKSKKIWIDGEKIEVHPYVLPHWSKLSVKDQRLSGKINEQAKSQGFYLYRNDRLIVWGDYLGLTKKTELGKNLRIRVDIPNSMDYLWDIDIKKSRARVPSKISKNLISSITDGEQVSRDVNTYRGKKEHNDNESIWNLHESREGDFHFELNEENAWYKQFIGTLDSDQLKLFQTYQKALASNIPYQTIYAKLADGKKQNIESDVATKKSLMETIDILKQKENIDYAEMLKILLLTKPYSEDIETIKIINNELEKEG